MTVPMKQDQLKWLLPDGSPGSLVVSKVLSHNHNFSFHNQILLLLTSSSYPIVLTGLGGPYIPRKMSMYKCNRSTSAYYDILQFTNIIINIIN